MSIILSKRLMAAASRVPHGARVIDVGTDHAYIPIYLVEENIASFTAGSDINIGPLKSAEVNLSERGLSEKISLYLSDGLRDVHFAENKYDHILICGMGGELIVSIIDSCEHVKRSGITLILQPMTMQTQLREYLSEHGFAITDEDIIKDGKFYQIIVCSYTGESYRLSDSEKLIGKINIQKGVSNPDFTGYIEAQQRIIQTRIDGKRSGGEDTEDDEILLNELKEMIK